MAAADDEAEARRLEEIIAAELDALELGSTPPDSEDESAPPQQPAGGADAVPSYFQAFAECLQEWSAEVAADTDENLSQMFGEVDGVQRLLQESADRAWAQGVEAFHVDDRQELETVAEEVLRKRREEEAESDDAQRGEHDAEQAGNLDSDVSAEMERGAGAAAEAGETIKGKELPAGDRPTAAASAVDEVTEVAAAQEAEVVGVEPLKQMPQISVEEENGKEHAPETPLLDDDESSTKLVWPTTSEGEEFGANTEAEDPWADGPQATAEQLEEEKLANEKRLKEEMEARAQEEQRQREEMEMFSEEMRLRDFYSMERSMLLHNRRCMVAEDRHCQQLRRAAQQRVQEVERSREASETARMAQEDNSAKLLRSRENEQREMAHMQVEETASQRLRDELRLHRERKAMEQAEKESIQAKAAAQEAWETQRMKLEDEAAARQATALRPVALQRRKAPAPVLELSAKQDPNDVIAALLQIPDQDVSKCEPSTSSSPRKLKGPVPGLPALPDSSPRPASAAAGKPWRSSSGERRDTRSSATPAILDPFADLASEGASRPTPRADPSPSPRPTPRLCGTLLCQKLLEGRAGLQPLGDLLEPPSGALPATCRPSAVGEDSNFELDDPDQPRDLIRLDRRMEELTAIPSLQGLQQLKVLILTSNKLQDLSPLQHCPHLEELALCTNHLSSLSGLAPLKRLAILKATQNTIIDATDVAQLPALRHVELSMNKLTTLPVQAHWLVKLVVYRNGLTSLDFLKHLPSLTHLDAGRNKITAIDAAITRWNPLLHKLFLEENAIEKLPELSLPLLTTLSVDSNSLEVLGPLGFLPSLERLQASHNSIRTLGSPLAASPLLQSLGLAFNSLSAKEVAPTLRTFSTLSSLHLNDNPLVDDLMEAYHPWVLRQIPNLQELDNETVSVEEREKGVLAKVSQSCVLSYNLASLPQPLEEAVAGAAGSLEATPQRRHLPRHRGGRRALLDIGSFSSEAEDYLEDDFTQVAAVSSTALPSLSAQKVQALQASSWRQQWLNAFAGDKFEQACPSCTMGPCCQAMTASRNALIVSMTQKERTLVGTGSSAEFAVLALLQHRHDFWIGLVKLSREHYAELLEGPVGGSVIVPLLTTAESVYTSRHIQRLLTRLQAHWRRKAAKRLRQQLWLEKRWADTPASEQRWLIRVQARWRGWWARRALRASGLEVLADRHGNLREEAALKLQAAVRGSFVRQRLKASLKWARQMSEIVDHNLTDCPEVDVADLLGDMSSLDNLSNPFTHLAVPDNAPKAMPGRSKTSSWSDAVPASPVPLRQGAQLPPLASQAPAPAPVTAWETPPRTADSRVSDLASSPTCMSEHMGNAPPQRTRSLSSTAESAVLESTGGLRGLHQVERLQRQHPDEDTDMAKAYLASQKKRRHAPPRPPALNGSQSQVLAARASGARARQSGMAGSKSVEPASRKEGKPLKAQDAIAEYRRQQAEEQQRASPSPEVPSPSTLEFQSGTPNLRLMRSSKGMQPSLGSSPRASSPKRGFGI